MNIYVCIRGNFKAFPISACSYMAQYVNDKEVTILLDGTSESDSELTKLLEFAGKEEVEIYTDSCYYREEGLPKPWKCNFIYEDEYFEDGNCTFSDSPYEVSNRLMEKADQVMIIWDGVADISRELFKALDGFREITLYDNRSRIAVGLETVQQALKILIAFRNGFPYLED